MTNVDTKIHSLLDPSNCCLLMIDFQPQMCFAVASMDGQTLIHNAGGLAESAKIFNIPTVLTSVAEKSFSGPTFPQITSVFPEKEIIDRTTMNSWEDQRVVDAIKQTGRKKIVIAGLWTEVCIVSATIMALEDGYEVYVIADACGGVTQIAHDMAMMRIVQAGAVPMTWIQFLLELQRDWARTETYDAVTTLARRDAGSYGMGIEYAKAMLGEHASESGD